MEETTEKTVAEQYVDLLIAQLRLQLSMKQVREKIEEFESEYAGELEGLM